MLIRDEIKAIMERDPAARSIFEALLYPSLHAIVLHRLAHRLYLANVPFFPRLISQFSRFITGIEIHPGAKIGRGLFIDHGMGVVVGETAEIGDNCTLYQGTTLGGTGKETGKRHPTLGNNVLVGVGAMVLGAITIGDNARIGGGAVVLKDVPPNATAVGVPARVVAIRTGDSAENLRVENMPDPQGDLMYAMQEKIMELEARLVAMLEQHQHAEEDAHLALEAKAETAINNPATDLQLQELATRLERLEQILEKLNYSPAR